ncbi:metal ABC transporter substrate-binding protein [Acidovorax sp. SUPP2522]|uniref:MetQ/NlpA family ABC transporter substrate-binding protein n=1 Tax=unclassified Acidovorax TaxID=2684926 RepID=UPI00234A183E|nr:MULTISPECIES: MetQ/NlpA family ABC transporter substrate-binding protein [unclassified Acidovorax]WCM98045.1 MetQ/NlpA family ABC transporter substrate-binding protein [Acidovorax sp. GBBC 1281]GKT00709.1 metal ABC transporter substrate-binding protein [Acidovorax sp. SUPP3434]GKT16725.1 metal ABC transporter substrate-binding protein [Acidovorax sp. SUPP2522]
MPLHRLFLAPLLALSVLGALPAHAADKLRIGVLPGVYADAIAAAAKDAKAQGIDVTVTEFTDWTTPNVAVDSGDLDINFFQHQPFLDNAIQKNGFKLASAGTSFLANIGLYSLKHKTINEVPVGGKVGLANDPVNQGRGLLLLQKAGLIQLKPGVGFVGTVDDIVQNPRKLKFVEVEGPQLVRITGDVDIAQGYPHFIVASKAFDPSSGLAYSGVEDARFAIQFVVKASRTQDPVIQKFVKVFQNSDAVKAAIDRAFAGDKRLYVLTWTQQ